MIGQMQPFDPANEQISTLERAKLFFQANGIEGPSATVNNRRTNLRTVERPAGSRETGVKDSGPVDTSFSEALRTKTGSNRRDFSFTKGTKHLPKQWLNMRQSYGGW